MNLANKLTLTRAIIVPFFVACLLIDEIPYNTLWALLLFVIASITDMLDGKIARKYDMVTDFGKFLDPLADKILVVSALICFVEMNIASSWLVIIIVAREFVVSGIRLVAAGGDNKVVIAASIWGKLKTASTMTAISVILVLSVLAQFNVKGFYIDLWAAPDSFMFPSDLVASVLIYICTILTVISGAQYVWSYRDLLKETGKK